MNGIRQEIAKASATARAKMGQVEQDALESLLRLYQNAATRLGNDIRQYANDERNLALAGLQEYLRQVNAVLARLQQARDELLHGALLSAAELGAAVWITNPAAMSVIAESAVRFIVEFIAADGLKLSDRLWRIDRWAPQAIADALRLSILQSQDASRAAAEFIARNESVPLSIMENLSRNGVDALSTLVRSTLITSTGNPYAQVLRVFRTEMNRAHGEAYQQAAGRNPDVIGMRFNLSPAHPKFDQCDLHAHANLHGLGPGVYPVGQSPWPAHPNTMSYLTAVFRDEIRPADQATKQDRIGWLTSQPEAKQQEILGLAKATALRAGVLSDADLDRPWRELKETYEKRGYRFGSESA